MGRLIVAQVDMGDHARYMGIDVHQRGGHGTSSLQVGFSQKGRAGRFGVPLPRGCKLRVVREFKVRSSSVLIMGNHWGNSSHSFLMECTYSSNAGVILPI